MRCFKWQEPRLRENRHGDMQKVALLEFDRKGDHMAENILVAYSSRTGTTGAIAEEMADMLRATGNTVTVSDASTVTDVAPFNTVILGSPIYGGAVRDELISFCELHQIRLIGKKVAVFTVGMLPVSDPIGGHTEHEGAVERIRLRAPGI